MRGGGGDKKELISALRDASSDEKTNEEVMREQN